MAAAIGRAIAIKMAIMVPFCKVGDDCEVTQPRPSELARPALSASSPALLRASLALSSVRPQLGQAGPLFT